MLFDLNSLLLGDGLDALAALHFAVGLLLLVGELTHVLIVGLVKLLLQLLGITLVRTGVGLLAHVLHRTHRELLLNMVQSVAFDLGGSVDAAQHSLKVGLFHAFFMHDV